MALICNVGLSKKHGLPDYGSLGASCNVQFELDATLLQTDPEAFQREVRKAYVGCARAVNDELARHKQPNNDPQAGCSPTAATDSEANDDASNDEDNDLAANSNGHRATVKQLDFVRQLASQIRGLGVRRSDAIANQLLGKPLAALTTQDASDLIDTLKEIRAGKIDLGSVLGRGTS